MRKTVLMICLFFICCFGIANASLPNEGNYFFDEPEGIGCDSEGNIYVHGKLEDRYYGTLLRFSNNGEYIGSIAARLFDMHQRGRGTYDGSAAVADWNAYIIQNDNKKVRFKDKEIAREVLKYLDIKPDVDKFLNKVIKPYPSLTYNSRGQLCVFGTRLTWSKIIKKYNWGVSTSEVRDYAVGILDQKDGHPIKVFGEFGAQEGQLGALKDIAVDAQDNIYVADGGRGTVLKFDRDGNFIAEWGKWGRKEGEFFGLKYLAVDKKNNLVYTGEDRFIMGDWDAGMHRVQKFTTDGKFIAAWGEPKPDFLLPWQQWEEKFYSVEGLDVDVDGNVFVLSSDPVACAVRKYNPEGEEIARFGEGILRRNISGLVIDPFGNIWVCDTYNNRVVKFSKKGEMLLEIKSKK